MQCSCCHTQSDNLREYSLSALGPDRRKTIVTLQMCTMCRILYRIRPALVAERAAREQCAPRRLRRVAGSDSAQPGLSRW